MALLAQKNIQNTIAFAGTLAAGEAEARVVQRALIDGERLTTATG
jgi:hypothetical protein